jgi:hypothetical protein
MRIQTAAAASDHSSSAHLAAELKKLAQLGI